MTRIPFRLRAFVLEPNRNKSLPIGTIAAVKEYLEKLGSDAFFNEIKERGERLFPLVCALISYRSTENFSIEGCGRRLGSSEVRNELGIRKEISHRMLDRATERIGECMPEALSHLRRSLLTLYDLPPHTDQNIDTSSVAVYAKDT